MWMQVHDAGTAFRARACVQLRFEAGMSCWADAGPHAALYTVCIMDMVVP